MKQTRLRRTAKEGTLGYWKKKLWTEFSKYIRKRDDYICFTCGKVGNHAGHMIPRALGGLSLYFHERNVHCQCYFCNINLGGNGAIYATNFIKRYGQEAFDEILELKSTYKKYTIDDYKELIGVYKKKLEQLNEESN